MKAGDEFDQTNTPATIRVGVFSLSFKEIKRIHGKKVFKFFLTNGTVSITICNLGCSIISINTPDKFHVYKNIVSGFDNVEEYLVNKDYFGSIIGRYANRIARGRFTLESKSFQLAVNDGENHLHGGWQGFNKKVWDVQAVINEKNHVGVTFKYMSVDGEEGYPGNLEVKTSYILDSWNQLHLKYETKTDRATPLNLTNHSYFNLTGFDDPFIYNHFLQVNATSYTEKNKQNIPTGNIFPVSNTSLDFRKMKQIGIDIDQFPLDLGYDHNFILNKEPSEIISFAAKLYEPHCGRFVNVYTSEPAIQVYTANFWNGSSIGLHGEIFQKHGAIALETQSYPDSPNHSYFPNTILYPGNKHMSETIYEFGVE